MDSLRAHGLGKAYRKYRNKWGRRAKWLGALTRHELHWVQRSGEQHTPQDLHRHHAPHGGTYILILDEALSVGDVFSSRSASTASGRSATP